MRSEVVAFIISNSLRALILFGSFSKCRIVIVSSIDRISCPVFSICSENVDFPVDVFIKSGSEMSFYPAYVELVEAIAC